MSGFFRTVKKQGAVNSPSLGRGAGVLLLFACLTLLASVHAVPAAAAPPPAGTVLENRAGASYRDTVGDHFVSIQSNTVLTVVAPVEALTLVAEQQISRSLGSAAVFAHRLTNSGNSPSKVTFTLVNDPGDGFDLIALTLYLDTNGNGLVDSSDPVVAPAGITELASGQSVDLIAYGIVPNTAPTGGTAGIRLGAVTALQGATAVNGDGVRVFAGAQIDLVKSVSNAGPDPGEVVTYSLSVANNGGSAAAGAPNMGSAPVVVDGVPLRLVLIRDVVPANTAYVAGSLEGTGGARLLYHKSGDPAGTFVSVEPAAVDEVGCGIAALEVAQVLRLSFKARVNGNAAGRISNTAQAFHESGDPSGGGPATSNTVESTVAEKPAIIKYFTDNTYSREAVGVQLGAPVYLQADASRCNTDPQKQDLRSITVISSLTGDEEAYPAVETGPNTGLFRILPDVPVHDGKAFLTVHGNGIVEALSNDMLTARIEGCGGAAVKTRVFIDPVGVVFDSRSNEPVAGARVAIIDVDGAGNGGMAGLKATVYASDATTIVPSEVTTGPDGRFEFPLVLPSSYRFVVVPPNGYRFASGLGVDLMPPGRNLDGNASYGLPFPVNAQTGAVRFDIPIDPGAAAGLFAEKSASVKTAEIGDFVDYAVRIKNGTGKTLKELALSDTLPRGFVYEKGSARLDGLRTGDPDGGWGPGLAFRLGTLNAGITVALTYRVKIGAGSALGDNANRAAASAAHGTVSNEAAASVKVIGGVFSEKGYIVGKVYLDCDRNRVQDPEEIGIPGVRLYLEDGSLVVTDSEGKYSFYGVSPRTHVLKLDATTMPAGSELIELSNRNAGDAGSRFVDLKNGELHKADFAEGSCAASLVREVIVRRTLGEMFVAESDQRMKTQLSLDPVPTAPADPKGLPAGGLIGPETRLPSFGAGAFAGAAAPNSGAAGGAAAPDPPGGGGELPEDADDTLAFVDLEDGDVLPGAQTDIFVKGREGGRIVLEADGAEVPGNRIGTTIRGGDRHVEALNYIGIDLKPGKNRLTLKQFDPYGNPRGSVTITVTAPDHLKKIAVAAPQGNHAADGRSPVTVRVDLVDDKGVPVKARTPLTLETSLGRFRERDLDEKEPGVQVFVEGGAAEFLLIPPGEPGTATIRATSGIIRAETGISFVPELRPMVASGLAEGVINFRGSRPSGLVAASDGDGFERELRAFSAAGSDGRGAAGRAALFLKGKVKGDYLLTLAYDSEKETGERMFRDIQPDQFYPVYGDSSVRGYDAQSTGKLYVRVDKDKSFLLLGDYGTASAGDARVLGAYGRSLTGVRGHYEERNAVANVFASQDRSSLRIEEIAAGGTSGPYYLAKTDMVENSERVEIVVRDRNQPSVILKSTPQTRFSDYEIEPLSGRIVFKAPVPTYDPDPKPTGRLDPQFIRVTYEAEQGGDRFWVAGADGQVKITDRWEVGGNAVRDENPADRFALYSANTTIRLADKTFLLAELARASRESTGSGDGERIELRHENDALKARIQATRTDPGFDNPSAGFGKGRLEATATADYRLSPTTTLRGEALHSEDTATGGRRDGVMAGIERTFGDVVKAELGVRHSRESAAPAMAGSIGITPLDLTTVRTRFSGQVPSYPKVALFGEYEQSIDEWDSRVAALGGEYKFSSLGRFYLRHELISSLTGSYGLNASQRSNATLIGVDSDYMKDGHVFSEYRVRDALSGRDAEAALGLRNAWDAARGVRLHTGLERVQTLGGASDNTATAITGALEYTPAPRFKGSVRAEARFGSSADTYLNTMGAAYKLNRDVTLLGRQVLAVTDGKSGTGDRFQERFQLGFAYRPVDTDVWNALGRYEFKFESDESGAGNSLERTVSILSGHLNYQPYKALTLSGMYAGKLVRDHSNGLSAGSNTHMLLGRAVCDLAKRWDLGLAGSTIFSGAVRSARYGLGAEGGYLVAANLWLSLGYNFMGYTDRDLSAEEYTSRGGYLRLRFKFDENLFAAWDPNENKTLAPPQPVAPAVRTESRADAGKR